MPSRLEREFQTINAMINIYCENHHQAINEKMCDECTEILKYAQEKLSRCPFQNNKPTCGKCLIHCYNKTMQTEVKAIMRFAGPKMIWRQPMMAIQHLIDCRKSPCASLLLKEKYNKKI